MTPDWAHAEELDALAEERDEARRELAQAQREVKSLSSSLTHWKNLLTRRTTTLRNRAERAERELGELRSAANDAADDIERGRHFDALATLSNALRVEDTTEPTGETTP